MNGSVARRIRKAVYGDQAQRAPQYGYLRMVMGKLEKVFAGSIPGERGTIKIEGTGQIVSVGLRGKYRAAKKAHKKEDAWQMERK